MFGYQAYLFIQKDLNVNIDKIENAIRLRMELFSKLWSLIYPPTFLFP